MNHRVSAISIVLGVLIAGSGALAQEFAPLEKTFSDLVKDGYEVRGSNPLGWILLQKGKSAAICKVDGRGGDANPTEAARALYTKWCVSTK